MSHQPPELLLRGDRATIEPWAQRDNFHRIVNGLGLAVLRPGDAVEETLNRDNSFFLTSGDHLGFTSEKAGTKVVAAAGVRITRLVTIEQDAHIEGVEFFSPGGENNETQLVYLTASANVTFVNCRFRRLSSQSALCVFAESGATARFVGCDFLGSNATGTVFSHAGAAGNIGVLGSNTTGAGLGTVTSVFVTT